MRVSIGVGAYANGVGAKLVSETIKRSSGYRQKLSRLVVQRCGCGKCTRLKIYIGQLIPIGQIMR